MLVCPPEHMQQVMPENAALLAFDEQWQEVLGRGIGQRFGLAQGRLRMAERTGGGSRVGSPRRPALLLVGLRQGRMP